ncbi:unnamed protein product [Prunus armeniaca]|uniref:Uncharacterized protein n=1 Tax=Prunus armeniaca TaxID=36596 RepID=A0A6J5X862_PRUAR|nr:unnamed protein product [Prunus armeniaca]
MGAFRYLRSLNLSDCHRLTTSALWPIAAEAVCLLVADAEERGPKGGWRRLLKRRRGKGKLLRRWAMAKMVVELKRINKGKKEVGKKVTGFVGRGRGSGWLLSWGSGFVGMGCWLGWRVRRSWGFGFMGPGVEGVCWMGLGGEWLWDMGLGVGA